MDALNTRVRDDGDDFDVIGAHLWTLLDQSAYR